MVQLTPQKITFSENQYHLTPVSKITNAQTKNSMSNAFLNLATQYRSNLTPSAATVVNGRICLTQHRLP